MYEYKCKIMRVVDEDTLFGVSAKPAANCFVPVYLVLPVLCSILIQAFSGAKMTVITLLATRLFPRSLMDR